VSAALNEGAVTLKSVTVVIVLSSISTELLMRSMWSAG